MTPTLKGTYKGYEIEHNPEFSSWYSAKVGESTIKSDTLDKMCKKIDGIERKDFRRVAVIKSDRYGRSLVKAEVTSHADDNEAWTVDANGNRGKERAANLYLDTEDTAGKLRMASELQDAINTLKKDQDQVIASIERYKISA